MRAIRDGPESVRWVPLYARGVAGSERQQRDQRVIHEPDHVSSFRFSSFRSDDVDVGSLRLDFRQGTDIFAPDLRRAAPVSRCRAKLDCRQSTR